MSLHQTTFYSNALQMNTTAYIILPEQKNKNNVPLQPVNRRLPVVWLLHGLFDDESMFLRYTSIERYASDNGMAVVLPRAERSFYTDMVSGGRYWHFITEELPQRLRFFYPLSLSPTENFVAGASMGGYGAYKWAFTYPNRFAAVAAMSGVMDISQFGHDYASLVPDWHLIFGQGNLDGTSADLKYLIQHITDNQLYVLQTVGTEDFLFDMNQSICATLKNTFETRYTYLESTGNHDFEFWDKQLPTIMAWFKKILISK